MLLILASVSITVVFGDNGILQLAKEAGEKTNEAKDSDLRQIAMAEAAMNLENTKYKDVTIPAGFAPTRIEGESTVDEGLVIIDSEGNEFVWIPVEDGFEGEESLSDIPTWEKEEYEEMKQSVNKYKGFFIGRYEAGSTTVRKGWQTEGNGTTKMVVKRDQYPYVLVGWGQYNEETKDYSDDMIYLGEGLTENNGKGAVYLCRHMYDGKSVGVKSTLCYEEQWDAMLNFIEKHDFDTKTSSTDWGNYYGSEFEITRKSAKKQLVAKNGTSMKEYVPWESAYGTFGATNASYLLTTGASDRNMAANIYDVAGNCDEWQMAESFWTNEGEWRHSRRWNSFRWLHAGRTKICGR